MSNKTFGLLDTVFLAVIIVPLVAFLLFMLPRFVRGSRRSGPACTNNLKQIVTACITYQEYNNDFFPAAWDGKGFHPMASLSLLYPAYIDNPQVFACPGTKDEPEISTQIINGIEIKSFGPVTGKTKCSYLYDPLSHYRDVGPSQAMAADADGTAWEDVDGKRPEYPGYWRREPRKPNHDGGQNVMYYDGHVRWQTTNYASDDPYDNIYCPQVGWGADTDAYVWDGVNPRQPAHKAGGAGTPSTSPEAM